MILSLYMVHQAALAWQRFNLQKCLGNRVIATGTSGKKLEIVKSWGADHVVNTLKDGITAFREEVKDLTDGRELI